MKICYKLLFNFWGVPGEPYVESRGIKVSWRPHHTGDIKYNKEK